MSPSTPAELRRWLIEYVADCAGLTPAEVDTDASWQELGLRSRDAVALSGDLEIELGRDLSPTVAWEFPSIERLIQAVLGTGAEPEPSEESAAAERDTRVAVVGIGCRFPGSVYGPADLWRMLSEGAEGVGRIPDERWSDFRDATPETAAAMENTTRWAALLDDIDGFDAEYFGISGREADTMDPQQRMLLEVSQEALQHAGIAREQLRAHPTGVFVGVSATDYGQLTTADMSRVDAWTGTGAALSIAANRLSYQLDLRGPSMAVDTACSSSLVAVHLAVDSLCKGESDTVLAAGANLVLSPAITINFDRAGTMARDGRCKTFDAAADGYVRGEGCGVVVLKRLADARRDGNQVLAVIRGSAVNSDGRSNGLMAPNPVAQQELLRTAYRRAGVDPLAVDYVEAHGTGTELGDPIEANALGEVCGVGRSAEHPLLIGSVKTNLGHLEAAAGIAGLIKVVLSLAHHRIPRSLHFTEPNPKIAFDRLNLEVAARTQPWPRSAEIARAGVSAFGFGGMNAHVVLEQAESVPRAPVWVFSGQGSQWAGMGRRLLAEEPAFAKAVDGLEPVFHTETGFSLRAVLEAGDEVTGIDRVQPVLFGMQVALAELWRAHGVEPAAVIGHSMGEVAAAVVAGALDAEDGIRVVARRARLLRTVAGDGAMAVLSLSREKAAEMAAEVPGTDLAVHASPRQTVVAGATARVEELIEHCAAHHVAARLVKVDVASHTPQVDPLLPELRQALAGLSPHTPTVRFYSTVTDDPQPSFDADYWADNLRRTVRFTQAVDRALTDGHAVFTEISPHPLLLDAISETAGTRAVLVTPTLRRDRHDFSPLHPPVRSWRHTRHWLPAPRRSSTTDSTPAPDTLLGRHSRVATVPESDLWQARLIGEYLPYPQRHEVRGAAITPASVLVNTLLTAENGPVGRVRFLRPLPADREFDVQVIRQDGRIRLLGSTGGADAEPVVFLTAERLDTPSGSAARPAPLAEAEDWSPEKVQRVLDEQGVRRAAYPWRVAEMSRADGRARVRVELPAPCPSGPAPLLDALLQLAPFAAPRTGGLAVPGTVDSVRYESAAEHPEAVLHLELTGVDTFDALATDTSGTPLLALSGIRYHRPDEAEDTGGVRTYAVTWRPAETDSADGEPGDALVVESGGADPVEEAVTLCRTAVDALAARAAAGQRLAIRTRGLRTGGAVSQGVLWGLARVAEAERPESWRDIADTAALGTPDTATAPGAEEPGADSPFALALTPLEAPVVRDRFTCRPGATYLITGGLGALGLETARHLASRGARRLVLLGRSTLPPRNTWGEGTAAESDRRIAVVRELEAAGVTVQSVGLDIAEPGALDDWLARYDHQGQPPVRGVVHAAGVLADRPLHELDDDALRRVLRPKVGGADALHRAFPPGTLDFLVFFSSAATFFGVPGQGAYAAANGYLDALARDRAARGCHTLSLNWGAWDSLGFAASEGGRVVDTALRENGLRPLTVPEALAAWDEVHRREVAQAVVVATTGEEDALPALLRAQPDAHPDVRDWAALSADEREREMRQLVAAELGSTSDAVDPHRPLAELGLDSITSLRIRKRIERRTGLTVGATVTWNHPTVRALTSHLDTLLEPSPAAAAEPPPLRGTGLDALLSSIEKDHP